MVIVTFHMDSEIPIQRKCTDLTLWQPSVGASFWWLAQLKSFSFLQPVRCLPTAPVTLTHPSVPFFLSPMAQGAPECWGLEDALLFRLSRSFATHWSPVDPSTCLGTKDTALGCRHWGQRVMCPYLSEILSLQPGLRAHCIPIWCFKDGSYNPARHLRRPTWKVDEILDFLLY